MKRITFNAIELDSKNRRNLIKAVSNVSCNLLVDADSSTVIATNIAESSVDSLMDIVEKYFVVSSISIENTDDSSNVTLLNTVHPTSELHSSKPTSDEEETSSASDINSSAVSDTSDSATVKNPYEQEIDILVDKLRKLLYFTMYKAKKVSLSEMQKYVYSFVSEINMEYFHSEEIPSISTGDVVVCDFGYHLTGEIRGGHVAAIVCEINPLDGMVCLAPITKHTSDITSINYLSYSSKSVFEFLNRDWSDGTVLVDKARLMRPQRIIEVIGRTTPEFFDNVLDELKKAFDIKGRRVCISKNSNTVENSKINSDATSTTINEPMVPANNNTIKPIDANLDSNPKSDIEPDSGTSKTNGYSEEESILVIIGTALSELNHDSTSKDRLSEFLNKICLDSNSFIIDTFLTSLTLTKINYANLVGELHVLYPSYSTDEIRANLQKTFKNWKYYKELVTKHPKISIISLLKVYAKNL